MEPYRGVDKLLFRGLRGELMRGPTFGHIRATAAEAFDFISYATLVVLSIILSVTASSFAITLILYGFWTVLGFFFIALGTKLAHLMTTWGIAFVGALVSMGGVWSSIVRLSAERIVNGGVIDEVKNPGVVAVQLIIAHAANWQSRIFRPAHDLIEPHDCHPCPLFVCLLHEHGRQHRHRDIELHRTVGTHTRIDERARGRTCLLTD